MAETETPATPTSGDSTKTKLKRYTIIPFPKVVFFYPLMLVSLACGIMQVLTKNGSEAASWASLAGTLFIVTFFINVMVISFDFPGIKALALTSIVVASIFIILWVESRFQLKVFTFLTDLSKVIFKQVTASHMMYLMVSAIMFIMIGGGILGNMLWNRWTIEPNRLRHKHGIIGKITQYPVIDLQFNKDIEDVFEYLLLFSGTLTFQPNPDTPPIRLENIPFVNRSERKILEIIKGFRVTN